MMRDCTKMALTFAMVAALAGPAMAQGRGGYGGGINLIANPGVQKELKLDDNQIKKAEALSARMAQRFQVDMGKLKGLNQDEQMKRLPTLAGPHYDEGMKALRSFLKPDQIDRFDQILFQQRGAMAMLEPKIAKSLQLTNEQARKVADLVAEARNRQTEAMQAAKSDPKSAGPKLQAIAREANEKAAELLNEPQKKTWQGLIGVPFDPTVGEEPPR